MATESTYLITVALPGAASSFRVRAAQIQHLTDGGILLLDGQGRWVCQVPRVCLEEFRKIDE